MRGGHSTHYREIVSYCIQLHVSISSSSPGNWTTGVAQISICTVPARGCVYHGRQVSHGGPVFHTYTSTLVYLLRCCVGEVAYPPIPRSISTRPAVWSCGVGRYLKSPRCRHSAANDKGLGLGHGPGDMHQNLPLLTHLCWVRSSKSVLSHFMTLIGTSDYNAFLLKLQCAQHTEGIQGIKPPRAMSAS
jgi:hypothetical protein